LSPSHQIIPAKARPAASRNASPGPGALNFRAKPEPSTNLPFWKRKKLEELTPAEWESLCDGCGRCCLVKLEDEDDGRVHFTEIACKLLDVKSCRCADYGHRSRRVRDCIRLTPEKVRALSWLPPSCAYRLVAEERDLAWWHPLVSGTKSSVHEAGISVRGRIKVSERQVRPADYVRHIVAWPARSRARAKSPQDGSVAESPATCTATADGPK